MTLMTVCRTVGSRGLLVGCVGVCAGLSLWVAAPLVWAPLVWAEEAPEIPRTLQPPDENLSSPTPSATPAPTPSSAGLRVFIDPVTGEFIAKPSPRQAGELSAAIAEFRLQQQQDPDRGLEGLRRFELSGGGTGVFLDGRFLTSTVVRRGADGSFHFECTRDPQTDPHTHPENPAAHGAAPVK